MSDFRGLTKFTSTRIQTLVSPYWQKTRILTIFERNAKIFGSLYPFLKIQISVSHHILEEERKFVNFK